MQELESKEQVQEEAKLAFGRKKRLESKYVPKYPDTIEKQFSKDIGSVMDILDQLIKENMPAIRASCLQELNQGYHSDGLYDNIKPLFSRMQESLSRQIAALNVHDIVAAIGDKIKSATIREWKRAIKRSLNIDLLNDYYSDDIYQEIVRSWVRENVMRITTLPANSLKDMEQIIYDGFRMGKMVDQIAEDIMEHYDTSLAWARNIAVDQVGTLNSQITRMVQMDSGVMYYKWSTVHDSHVRWSHREFDGKIYSWNDPPESWHYSKGMRVPDGRRCHPGEDYGCRCIAVPVFDIDTIDIPVKNKGKTRFPESILNGIRDKYVR